MYALEGPMRRMVHPTPHSARHLTLFTRHHPASNAACHRHAAAHRPIESDLLRYLATCVTHTRRWPIPSSSRGQQRHSPSCARVDGMPPVSTSDMSSILIIVPNMKRDMSGRDSIVIRCRSHPHGTGATLSHLCRQASLRLRASTAYLSSRCYISICSP